MDTSQSELLNDSVNINTSYYANATDGDVDFKWTEDVVVRVATVMVIMVATIVGNVLLIGLIMHKKSRRIKRVNIFLANLAIGDLAVACLTMSTEIFFIAFGEWVLGAALCKILLYLQAVCLASATFLLTGMSVDRYQVIVKPMQSLANRPKIWTKVIVAWALAFISATPQLLIFVLVEKTGSDGTVVRICASRGYTANWQRKLNFTISTLYTLLIPAGIMMFCYINIIEVIFRRGRSGGENRHRQDDKNVAVSPRMSVQHNYVSAAKHRVVIMTLTVILGFLFCLTPYFIISVIRIYSNYAIQLKLPLAISETIFMCHSALNPILYGMFTFRVKHISSLFSRFTWKRRLREENERTRMINDSKVQKLRQLAIFRNGKNSADTTVVIANHSARDDFDPRSKARSNNRLNAPVTSSRKRSILENPSRYTYDQNNCSESLCLTLVSNDSTDILEDATNV